jgi:hypothetical protein
MKRRDFLKVSSAAPAVAAMVSGGEDRHSNVRWEQKLARGVQPQNPQVRDEGWPEIDVPNFR